MDQYSYEEKVAAIIDWAEETQDDFDLKMVRNCEGILDDGGALTEGQEEAIDNIISGWRIDVGDWA